jgi:hypothetical protein
MFDLAQLVGKPHRTEYDENVDDLWVPVAQLVVLLLADIDEHEDSVAACARDDEPNAIHDATSMIEVRIFFIG